MNNEQILELDLTKRNKNKKFAIAFFSYISLIVLFNVLSSYKNPTLRIHNTLIDYNTFQFQDMLKDEIDVLENNLIVDSTEFLDKEIKELLIQFYRNRNYSPAWINNFKTNQQFSILQNLLDSSAYWGFPYDYFNIKRIHELNNNFTYNTNRNILLDQIDLELTSTYASLKFIVYLTYGIVDRDTSKAYLQSIGSLPGILNKSLKSEKFRDELINLQPNLIHHRNLLKSLSYFIDLHYSVKYTTPAFIDDKLLAKSMYYAQITSSPVFNSQNTKADALFKLQNDYNLPKDSILNIPTHAILVSLLEQKYFLACLNLNRLRKLKHSGENYLFVNIPEFKLQVIEANQEKENFNVIVGKKKTPTPTLTSNIEKVIANPYWTVPRSITFEMLNKIRKDSTYLSRNGFFVINGREEIVDPSVIDWDADDPLGNKYWLRQKNSPCNALGQVKFIFPNEYSVYLHDTPSKGLFKLKNRTFSHGCIRLENPDKLAQYLTDNFTQQSKNKIESLISEKERHEINLSEKVKIHIQYITCSGSDNSEINFFDDIYNLDYQELKVTFPNLLEI